MRLVEEDGSTGSIEFSFIDWRLTAEKNHLRLYNEARVKGFTHQQALYTAVMLACGQGPVWFTCVVYYFEEV
jgi:hypothetical protein